MDQVTIGQVPSLIKKGRPGACTRSDPNFILLRGLFRFPRGHVWMVRDGLDLRFVHRLGSIAGESGPRRHDPILGRLGSTASSSDLDTGRINSLLGFAAR